MPVGELRPRVTPIGRRDIIRDALETGDWATAAEQLAEARHRAEHRMVAGITSWSAYVESLGISRMHGWRLCLIAATEQTRMGYNYRQALEAAITATRESAKPSP